VVRRVTLAGDVPVGVDGRRSRLHGERLAPAPGESAERQEAAATISA
jgi:hypothetical protein